MKCMKKLKGTMRLKFLIVSLLLSLVSIGQGQEGVVIDKIIAKVDDYIVLKSDLEMAYLDYLSRGRYRSDEARCKLLESLIVNKMLISQAVKDSVIVSPTEVFFALDRRMQMIIQQLGSAEELEKAYGKSMEQIREELFEVINEQLIVQKMQDELTSDLKVTPAEVRRFFNKIPKDSLPYFSREVTVGQIVREPKPGRDQKARTRAQLEQIRQDILNGASFGDMATLYSEDPGSAANGGQLPFYRRGELAPEFEAAAMTMQIGEISEPIETQFGFHVIELQDRRGNTFKTRHILMRPKPSPADMRSAERYLDSLRLKIVADSISFDKAAKEYSDDRGTSSNGGFFADPETGSLLVSVDDLDPDVFYVTDTLKINVITRPVRFQLPDGTYAFRILILKAKMPPHLANMNDDYQKIALAALNQKKGLRLNEWFEKARTGVYIEVDPEFNHCNLIE
jgi:peptidyl-prolyl cis-trans isomerase SurA